MSSRACMWMSKAATVSMVTGQYSKEFWVGVGVHQGSVLSPLLFILVLEALVTPVPYWCAMGASVMLTALL